LSAAGFVFKGSISFLILAGIAFGAAPSAPPASGAAAGGNAALAKLIPLITPDYKKAQELPDSFFNPFKVEATIELTDQRKAAAVTEQSVADAVGRKGVSGVIFAPEAGMNQVIIGDQVFRIGDELNFPDAEGGAMAPLLAGATVVLREVDAKNLVLEFTAEGAPPRRSTFSLLTFLRP
jgi:hypothetical protein